MYALSQHVSSYFKQRLFRLASNQVVGSSNLSGRAKYPLSFANSTLSVVLGLAHEVSEGDDNHAQHAFGLALGYRRYPVYSMLGARLVSPTSQSTTAASDSSWLAPAPRSR